MAVIAALAGFAVWKSKQGNVPGRVRQRGAGGRQGLEVLYEELGHLWEAPSLAVTCGWCCCFVLSAGKKGKGYNVAPGE